MRIPASKAAVTALRWLRSRFQKRTLVLGYHRVSDPTSDRDGLAVSPECFEEQMTVLARLTRPIPLSQLAHSFSQNGNGKPAVVVTFDDGYAENLRTAIPVLERFAIPATIFVVSGYLGREFWWDELDRLDARDPVFSHTDLRAVSDDQRRAVLNRLAANRRWRSAAPLYRAFTNEELRQVAISDLIEVGAHTVTHRLLPALSVEEQRRELEESRQVLEAIVGYSLSSFSYPHGALSDVTKMLVKETGFTTACCSKPDVVTARSDVLAVPRLWVQDWGADRFESFLRRWLVG